MNSHPAFVMVIICCVQLEVCLQVMLSEMRKVFYHEYGWPYFDEVFMVSALHGQGIPELKQYLLNRASKSKTSIPYYYPPILYLSD